MLLKTEINIIKKFGLVLLIGSSLAMFTHAEKIDCDQANTQAKKNYCSDGFEEQREKLDGLFLTAQLITDAPIRLLIDTQKLWYSRVQQCKNLECFKQQFELRHEDLNIYTSMNQSLTQHYLKFENGHFATSPVHLKVHQLGKDSIKIEGIAYRNPNNRVETQTIPFLAYTTPEQKNQITDNEHDCKYQFNYSKALLSVKTEQKGCERFAGIYRLYD
ncbi:MULTISPECIES: hypothetical protein [unclassified Acinetobacter]|uniref:A1S_1983 family putative colistin resistance protein n=1 Tax=unclassified Acinetobacter TaxID=196816 RepID=UPI0015D254B1|nr:MULTISPECIES: hypothetical protein [unclassified Acinetobacter]